MFHPYKRLCNPSLSTTWPCEGIWSCWGLHLVSPSALFDSPHSVCKQTSYEGDLCEDDPCCQCNQNSVWALFWCYQGLTKPISRSTYWRWSSVQHPCQSHPVTLVALAVAARPVSTIFWAVDLLTPVSAAVLSHTIFSDSFIPDSLCSMQNLNTFSIVALASSLYLHTSFAIVLSEVALHVHNTSKHAFLCKHVNHKKSACLLKYKKGFTGARTLNLVIKLFEYSRYTYMHCAMESLVKVLL